MNRVFLLLMTMVLSVSAASLNDKVIYLDNIKELVILSQKMRGDINVHLKGGDVPYTDLNDDRDDVDASLRDLHLKFQTVDIKTDDEFAKLNLYMQNLNDVSLDLTPMITFRAYTLLINEMITLGVDVQETLFIDNNERQQRASSVMMKNILPVTENLGKLRGLGSGVAAYGECDDDESKELKDYIVDVTDDLNILVLEMQSLNWTYKGLYPKSLNSELNRFQKEVKKYIELVELKLLDEDHVDVDTYDFFSQGTSLIDQTLKYYTMNEILLVTPPTR